MGCVLLMQCNSPTWTTKRIPMMYGRPVVMQSLGRGAGSEQYMIKGPAQACIKPKIAMLTKEWADRCTAL